jgi:GNAT superfamily N-acetyltransferase
MWNRVLAMTSSDIEYLPSIAEWYERQGVAWGVDVAPSDDVGTLLSSLLARGLAHVGFYTAMFGRAATPAGSIGGERNHLSFDVRWMQPQADESEEYISCFLEGHSLPVDDHTALRIGLRGLLGNPIFQWVGAWAGSQLASMGILMISDGIAYVATTATRPQFRRQGLQRILGMVRRERALSLGCQVIALHTAVGSAIQRGNDLLDYRVAYTKAIWRYREI